MVDREVRDKLIELINKFISCEISAFEFDELLFGEENSIEAFDSKDKTIDFIIHQLWSFYDDIDDHDADFSKDGWDYIQRLLLILKSDAEIEAKNRTIKSCVQLISLIMIILLIGAIYFFDFLTIPFLVIWMFGATSSFFIMRHTEKLEEAECKHLIKRKDIYPFKSYSQLAYLAKITGFKKRRFYQRNSGKKQNRSKAFIWLSYLPHLTLWPLFMFIGLLPSFALSEVTTEIKTCSCG